MFLSCSTRSREHCHSMCGHVSLLPVSPLLTQGLPGDRGPEETAAIRPGSGAGQKGRGTKTRERVLSGGTVLGLDRNAGPWAEPAPKKS